MNNTLKKYKLGLIGIGLITLGLLVLLVVQASATKADKATYKAAVAAAQKLNSNYSTTVPDSLAQAGIKNVPSSISYTKLSRTSYKFCVTYRTSSSNFDAQGTLFNLASGGSLGSGYDYYGDSNDSSYLVIDTAHKKGQNCQTIKMYSGSTTCDNAYSTYSYYCASPLQSSPSASSSASSNSNSSSSSSSKTNINKSAQDTERKTDINSLQAHIEAYFAMNDFYPGFNDINSATWRATNMQGLDASALCDPTQGGSNCTLASTPKSGVYSYAVTEDTSAACGAQTSCDKYTLTATLSDGTTYTKSSLN